MLHSGRSRIASVGIDITEVGEVESAIGRFGTRYLERVFTPAEIRTGTLRGPRYLAACFAAKEAAMKALGINDNALGWRSIELRRSGTPELQLQFTGRAAEVLAQARADSVAVDVATTARYAAAIVIVAASSTGS